MNRVPGGISSVILAIQTVKGFQAKRAYVAFFDRSLFSLV